MEIEDMLEQMFGGKIYEDNGKPRRNHSQNHSQNHTHNYTYNKSLISEIYTFIKGKNPYKLSILKSGTYAITLNDKIIVKLFCEDLIEAKYEYIIKVMEF